jgi:hypothetical protein
VGKNGGVVKGEGFCTVSPFPAKQQKIGWSREGYSQVTAETSPVHSLMFRTAHFSMRVSA